ncbi:MAG: 2-methylcitrate dehydratase PrpD [Alphaproteobacteria bacterium]|jgi:2-methylcitrate dehydratase PrpD
MPASYQPDPTGALSRRIAAFCRNTTWQDIPETVRHEAKRSILNGFATALAGAHEPAIEKSLGTLHRFSANQSCSLTGRSERTDMLFAAYINAMAANIADYDDTHPATVIHPTAPVAPALFAYAETIPTTGQDLLRAFILGAEIECRLGNAVSPYHYARGWHITSTCGVFGSAIAIGMLLDLTENQFVHAISNATAHAAGMVETLGTMSKSISVGNSARNGIVSALLAAEDFSGPTAPLEGERGFLSVYANEPKPGALTSDLGQVWEIAKNTYKPYPVGVVINPILEACLQLHAQGSVAIEDVASVELTGHPLLQQRANRPSVTTGREAQVSAQHAIAIALRRGRAGLSEFSDEAVAETARDNIRPPITFIDDASYDIESARIVIHTQSGTSHTIDIRDTRGGTVNPLSDADLNTKLKDLAAYGHFPRDVAPLADALWSLDQSQDAGTIMNLASL